jgi:hypothetical protein
MQRDSHVGQARRDPACGKSSPRGAFRPVLAYPRDTAGTTGRVRCDRSGGSLVIAAVPGVRDCAPRARAARRCSGEREPGSLGWDGTAFAGRRLGVAAGGLALLRRDETALYAARSAMMSSPRSRSRWRRARFPRSRSMGEVLARCAGAEETTIQMRVRAARSFSCSEFRHGRACGVATASAPTTGRLGCPGGLQPGSKGEQR